MKLIAIVALGACGLTALISTRSDAHVPTQGQGQLPPGLPAGMTPDQLAQLLQQNPQLADVIRQRLQQSGLTPDQIRARLQASGYPANLLDAYLGPASPGQQTATPGVNELGAIQALGLQPISLQFSQLPVDTGLVRAVRGAAPESASNVFGVD